MARDTRTSTWSAIVQATLAVVALIATLVAVVPTTTAHAAGKRVGFGVVPATAKALDVRALFSFGLSPGSTAFDHVAVVNYSTKPLPLNVYAADALNATSGGFALRDATDHPTDLASWVTIDGSKGVRTVRVPGRRSDGSPGRVILPVSIIVPANATPGDHAAGIVASLDTLGKNPEGENIRLQQRVASRVYVQIGGKLHPDLAVTMISARHTGGTLPWQAGSVEVAYTITNGGNTRMGFRPSVQVVGPFGLGRREAREKKIAELLAGNSVTIHTTVHHVLPAGMFDVTVVAEPTAAIAAALPSIQPARQGIRIWFLSWSLVLLVVVALTGGAYLVVRRRRRRPTGGQSTAQPRHSTPRGVPATVSR